MAGKWVVVKFFICKNFYQGGTKTRLVNLRLMLPVLMWLLVFKAMLVLLRQERWHSRDAIPCSQSTEAPHSATIIQVDCKLDFSIFTNIRLVLCQPKCQQISVSWTSIEYQTCPLTYEYLLSSKHSKAERKRYLLILHATKKSFILKKYRSLFWKLSQRLA